MFALYLSRIIDLSLSTLLVFFALILNRRLFVCNITLRILPRSNPRLHNLVKTQGYLEYKKCDIIHRNVRSICLYVEITMTVSDKSHFPPNVYLRLRIAMMHRRNGRKTDIHAERKKSHASCINHMTKTKSKCHCSIPSSHAARSFFF